MPRTTNATTEQQAKTGELVAALKDRLHQAQNDISNNNIHGIDWVEIVKQTEDFAHHARDLFVDDAPPHAGPTAPKAAGTSGAPAPGAAKPSGK